MPPKNPKIEGDLEPYFQYHNRIASFLEWNLDWELSEDKPTPERLARAGFFSYTKPPYQDDNVVCAYCTIALDSWESHDDPMREHKARSPSCPFVRGRQTVRNMNGDDNNNIATATTTPKAMTSKQDDKSDVPRPKRPYRKRGAGASKANELALAGANAEGEGAPQKRRSGRPRKRSRPG
ncbi:putative chromosome segregation protein [Diaporthe ampelina]|uniref:Putative chromosome segregation protein n=1 Tax=Diaporthe ampelina TaxID=1214573 RepID=A0A0G2I1I6_9PEZI|nr:putative chromosome segregation protein [Diaporthe ampelina]